MANKKGKTLAEQQYNKELRRIKQFIRRAEKRGYQFSADIIPEKPQRITQASVRKLQKIKPTNLYKKSVAISEEGYVITGTERRAEERKQSAQKAIQTKRERIAKASVPTKGFEKERRKQDKRDKERLKTDADFRNKFSQGEIVYNQILDAINSVGRDHQRAADHLKSVLDHEISTYGKDVVLRSIGEAPQEAIELADIALRYNPGDNRHDDAIRELLMLITGTIPTAEEARDLQNAIDSDSYTEDVE
jgi:flavodoxin